MDSLMPRKHVCRPPQLIDQRQKWGDRPAWEEGAVWRCECGRHWACQHTIEVCPDEFRRVSRLRARRLLRGHARLGTPVERYDLTGRVRPPAPRPW